MAETLLAAVTRYTEARIGKSPFITPIKGFIILRSDHPSRPSHRIFKPALCIVVQGAKWTTFGNKRFDYRVGQALVVSLEMPSYGRVVEATPGKPYLSIVIELDLTTMQEVLASLGELSPPGGEVGAGVFVTDFEGPMAECVLRMVHLLSTPGAIPALYPAAMRELCYWLLAGPRGGDIARIALAHGHDRQVLTAIQSLRERFAETVRIEELARIARMSPSAFHRQFKMFTSVTPLQYQKRLRLLEARNLMLAEAATAETVAFRVGYESASQFSREYARLFGAPPRRDVLRLRTPFRAPPGTRGSRLAAGSPR